MALAEAIYQELLKAGVEALIDDRTERPGVKFNDADILEFRSGSPSEKRLRRASSNISFEKTRTFRKSADRKPRPKPSLMLPPNYLD